MRGQVSADMPVVAAEQSHANHMADRADLKAEQPSSLLMNVIPAPVAGVQDVVMVAPYPEGVRNPIVLAAAD